MTRFGFLIVAVGLASLAAADELTVADLQIRGMSIHVPSTNQTLEIEPLSRTAAMAKGALSVVKPTWRNGFRLPHVAWTYASLTPGSVKARTVAEPLIELQEGNDFIVNYRWATIGAVPSSSVPAGTELQFDFSYTDSRIDLIESRADGTLTVSKGTPHMNAPLVPDPSPGCTPRFGVYLAHNTTSLSSSNINLISNPGPLIPPVENTAAVRSIMKGIQNGRAATIVFLGDSITAQSDVQGGTFVDRFAVYLQRRFHAHRVTVTSPATVVPAGTRELIIVKAGVGGNNSSQGLARFESDVVRHRPQIVVIMFGANDENRQPGGGTEVSLDQYRGNLDTMIRLAREAGAEPIILSPAMKNLNWVATSGLMDQFADAACQVAVEHSACCVDVHDAWQRIPTVGSNYMVYLNSSINHPNHLGHELFFAGLRRAVEDDE